MLRSHPYGAQFLSAKDSPELFEALDERVLFRYSAKNPSVSDRLEAHAAERFGVAGALTCPNGTQALRLALLATRPVSGSRIHIPAVTFVAVAGAVLSLGLIPVCVDVDDNFALDPSLLPEDAERVIVAHMDGMVAPIPQGPEFVIEDSAQAMGGRHADGQAVGSVGFAGTFSFHHAKVLTSGEGGLVVSRFSHARDLMRSYSDHGSAREQGKYPQWNEGAFFGENLTSNEAVAAVQLQQFRALDHILERLERHHTAAVYALAGVDSVSVVPRTVGDPKVSVHLEFDDPRTRTEVQAELDAAGLPSWSLDKYLLPDHPVLTSKASLFADGYPWSLDPEATHVSRDGFESTRAHLARRLVLPLAPEMSDGEQDDLVARYVTALGAST
ncbi:DegT/DnrJ/EryC1/StrS family aminotransferase [Knoellia sp. CPCC 206453]|uniref:DegT/DnrJ/EryC1/StrS family aminotransferase n=1 Tax=Knoellia pratensis TaxID=3404796 RepID=UPI00360BD686